MQLVIPTSACHCQIYKVVGDQVICHCPPRPETAIVNAVDTNDTGTNDQGIAGTNDTGTNDQNIGGTNPVSN